MAAHVGVRRDAGDAALTQRVARIHEQVDRLDQRLGDDGLHDVELELASLGRHGHGLIVADHLEADLVDDLGDNRVDLGGHDRRARGHLRKVDLVEASARAGSQQTQVVADLRQLDGAALDGRVHGDIGAGIGGGFEEIGRAHNARTRDATQVTHDDLLVAIGRVQTGTDSGRAQVRLKE